LFFQFPSTALWDTFVTALFYFFVHVRGHKLSFQALGKFDFSQLTIDEIDNVAIFLSQQAFVVFLCTVCRGIIKTIGHKKWQQKTFKNPPRLFEFLYSVGSNIALLILRTTKMKQLKMQQFTEKIVEIKIDESIFSVNLFVYGSVVLASFVHLKRKNIFLYVY
jgi:hypothetical protein